MDDKGLYLQLNQETEGGLPSHYGTICTVTDAYRSMWTGIIERRYLTPRCGFVKCTVATGGLNETVSEVIYLTPAFVAFFLLFERLFTRGPMKLERRRRGRGGTKADGFRTVGPAVAARVAGGTRLQLRIDRWRATYPDSANPAKRDPTAVAVSTLLFHHSGMLRSNQPWVAANDEPPRLMGST